MARLERAVAVMNMSLEELEEARELILADQANQPTVSTLHQAYREAAVGLFNLIAVIRKFRDDTVDLLPPDRDVLAEIEKLIVGKTSPSDRALEWTLLYLAGCEIRRWRAGVGR